MNPSHLCQIILKSDREISGYGQLEQNVIFAYHMVRQTPLIALPPPRFPDKYMDVISKDEPFRCESFSFFEQLGRKLIFFFLHKRSIFCSFPNFFLEIQYPLFSLIKMSSESLVYLQYWSSYLIFEIRVQTFLARL